MADIIYVLTNEAIPGMVKIGCTHGESVEDRIAQLSASTAVPLPFECHFAAEVENCAVLETKLHQLFADHRVNPRREFFKVAPERVMLAISIGPFTPVAIGKTKIEKDEREALERTKARRPRISLKAIGIQKGDVLTCSRDETITAAVVDGDRVEYEGETLSLSAAALKALKRLGYATTSVSGSEYWMIDGELLDERRQRIEEENAAEI